MTLQDFTQTHGQSPAPFPHGFATTSLAEIDFIGSQFFARGSDGLGFTFTEGHSGVPSRLTVIQSGITQPVAITVPIVSE